MKSESTAGTTDSTKAFKSDSQLYFHTILVKAAASLKRKKKHQFLLKAADFWSASGKGESC